MLTVIILSARWVARHLKVPLTASSRLGMGGIALALVLVLDLRWPSGFEIFRSIGTLRRLTQWRERLTS